MQELKIFENSDFGQVRTLEYNVYTKCNECGREISIDLFEHFDSGCDLCSTVCFCSECSKKMKKLKK